MAIDIKAELKYCQVSPQKARLVLDLIRDLHKDGHTIVLVTHNPDIANMGDRLINLIDGKVSLDSYIRT